MRKIELEAKTEAERQIKTYLEEHASEILAEKINNGVYIQKDGKRLLNKKTLSGFMKFACDEAKKQAEKGAQFACIDDTTVYGWAIHYFEEASIEETLYNEDGTQYNKKPTQTTLKPKMEYTPPKPKPKPQMSIFDLLDAVPESAEEEIDEDEPTEEEIREAAEQIAEEDMQNIDYETGEVIYQTSREKQEDSNNNTTSAKPVEQNQQNDEDEFDPDAYDAETVAILSEMFGDEIEVR